MRWKGCGDEGRKVGGLFDGGEEAAEVEGFWDEVDFGPKAFGVIEAEFAGDEDNFHIRVFVAEIEGEGVAGEAREADVEECDFGGEACEDLFGLFGAPGGADLMAEAFEEVGERFAADAIIFDE